MIAKKAVWTVLIGLVLCADVQARLLLLVSQESPLYHSFRQAFEAALLPAETGQEMRYLLADEYQPDDTLTPDSVVVAAGVEAAKTVAQAEFKEVSVIYTMLPLSSYHWLRDNDMLARNHKVVLIDQPAYRFINLARIALPDIKSLGYLYGEVSAEHTQPLIAAAERQQIKLQPVALQNDRRLATTLRGAVMDNDAILVLPDPYLFNRRAIQTLLLASLRGRKPLIAYSESYVKAGALLALYSSPEQLGRQSAEMVNCHSNECPLYSGPEHHPQYFSVKLNNAIARQLGLTVPSVEAIQAQLEALESKRIP